MNADFNKVTDYLNSLHTLSIPACALVVYHKNQPVFMHVTGYKDAQKTIPASSKDIYWLYSTSKVITNAAIMQLVERGMLRLDDEVSQYLPEFKDVQVQKKGQVAKAQNPITIRHLMTMTAGLTYNLETPWIKEVQQKTNNQASTRELVAAIAKEPLSFEPGANYQYSLCHDVLGAVIESVTGQKFGAYLKENIFDPLDMKDTTFRLTEENRARLSAQYFYDPQTQKSTETAKDWNPYRLSETFESGGAGLLSTVEDYIKFASALANGGVGFNNSRILNTESIDIMRTNQLKGSALAVFDMTCLPGYGYGLGVRTLLDPQKAQSLSPVGEFGWSGAAGAYTVMDAKNNLALFYAQHVLGATPVYMIHPTVRNLVYEAMGL